MSVFLAYYVSFARIVCHDKLDYLLYAFDGTLGPHINFTIAQVVSSLSPLRTLLNTTYDSVGFFMGLMFALHINLAGNRLNILKLNIINPIIGFSLYFLYPAMGPKYAFPAFPQLPGVLPLAPALLTGGPPNAMPSLHIGTALLIFFLARPWKWLRWITGVYLFLMMLAVFSTGEHYLVDTIVALPYALMIMALSSTTRESKSVLFLSAGMLGLWLFALRFGVFTPWISWALTLTTLAVTVILERRLAAGLWSGGRAPKESPAVYLAAPESLGATSG